MENELKTPKTTSPEPAPEEKSPRRKWLSTGQVDKHLKFIVFLVLIGLVYIWNAHTAEKQIRHRDDLKKEIRSLKAEYTTLHEELSAGTKQSVIAQRVDTLGLKVLMQPLVKLKIESD